MKRRTWRRIGAEWERAAFWVTLSACTAVLICWFTSDYRGELVPPYGAVPVQESLLNDGATAFLQSIPASADSAANPFAFTLHLPSPPAPAPAPPEISATTSAESPASVVESDNEAVDSAAPTPPASPASVPPPAAPPPAVDPVPVAPRVTGSSSIPVQTAETVPGPPVQPSPPATEVPPDAPADRSSDVVSTPTPPPPVRVVEFEYRGLLKTATGKVVALVRSLDPSTEKETYAYLRPDSETDGIRVRSFTREALWVVGPGGRECRILFGEKEQIALD